MSHDHHGLDRLIYMANQITDYFKFQPREDAAANIAEHIRLFWDPRMREKIFAHLDEGGEGLQEPARRALELLQTESTAALKADAPETAQRQRARGSDAG